MRGHTKSLDANDKLIQTRSHVRNAIASRELQVVMRKVKSTISAWIPNFRTAFDCHLLHIVFCMGHNFEAIISG